MQSSSDYRNIKRLAVELDGSVFLHVFQAANESA